MSSLLCSYIISEAQHQQCQTEIDNLSGNSVRIVHESPDAILCCRAPVAHNAQQHTHADM